jgi:hypothetical protein
MRTLPLSVSAEVALDSTGSGTASIGPSSSGETWSVSAVGVHCATNTAEATARVYSGASASPRYFVDATTWGSTGDSTDSVSGTLAVGMEVFAVWQGGDAGTTAYLTVTGTRTVA